MNIPAKLTLWTVLPDGALDHRTVSSEEKAMAMAAIRHVWQRAKRVFFAAPEDVVSPSADIEEVV